MKIKEKLASLSQVSRNKFIEQFGFKIEDVTFAKIVDYLHAPKDSSSLAITRILFGLAMLFDIPDERGGAIMEKRWGDPKTCHFPLFPFLQAMGMPYMAAVYAGLWFGAIGIMLGYKYRFSASIFTLCYWYLLLVEKSYWNNHSYLFGLVALLLTFTEASCYWSVDAYLDPPSSKLEVYYWNYFILKYQFFILYFMAGLKKGTAEWLTGYSVQNLSEHWVFEPFKLILTVPQTDYLIVHWFVFMFDQTVAFWMMYSSTRNVAMLFCATFHLMNSRLFRIGMFPWVCLATMPLFYPFDWPKTLLAQLTKVKCTICKSISALRNQRCNSQQAKDTGDTMDDEMNGHNNDENIGYNNDFQDQGDEMSDGELETPNKGTVKVLADTKGKDDQYKTQFKPMWFNRKNVTVYLIMFHVFSQAFLPFSHFITQGYNNWTNGLYGYSWDMMVHSWHTQSVIVQVVDNEKHNEFFLDPYLYSPNDRWTKHGDMIHQYARCLRENLMEDAERLKVNNERLISENISIYVDVWCSMNGRFTQRMFDPKVDILKAEWGPFGKVSYLMPILDEGLHWRADLEAMKKEIHSWNNYSDVLFLADFPGYAQEKYISEDLQNVTITVLEGDVIFQPAVTKSHNGQSVLLTTENNVYLDKGFHTVLNIGKKPAFYMYSFNNSTEVEKNKETPKLPVLSELYIRFYKTISFGNVMLQSLSQIFFSLSKCQ